PQPTIRAAPPWPSSRRELVPREFVRRGRWLRVKGRGMTTPSQTATLALMLLLGWTAMAAAQSAARALDLDSAPSALSTPDPLTPPETSGPPPAAPGVPAATGEARSAEQADPVVALVRERLATPPARASAADREDHAGLAAFYAEGNGQPVWTS